MRTTFAALETDHLAIHDDLAAEYNRTVGIDFSKVGKAIALDARDYGLGDGATADGTALQAAFTAATSLLSWGDRSIAGVRLLLPPGVFVPTIQHGNPAAATVRLSVACGVANGYVVVEGSTAGGTVIQAPNAGCGKGQKTVTGVTTRAANIFTVTCAGHGMAVGDPFVARLTSRANPLNFVSLTVLTVIDADHFTYIMGDASSGTLDNLKIANGSTIDKMGYLIEPTGFKQQNFLYFNNISFQGPPNSGPLNNQNIQNPNSLPSPQVGYAVRKTSRVRFTDCLFQGWWAAEVLCGAANGAAGSQNTDHNSSRNCQYQNNVDHILFLDNQHMTSGPSVGGSRDHLWRDCLWGIGARSMLAVSDGGQVQAANIAVGHDKGMPYPIYIEGVEGVLPNNQPKLSLVTGDWKNESPGNTALVWDESKLSSWDRSKVTIRSEVAIAINGGPGNTSSSTVAPWAVTTAVAAGVQTTVLPAGHAVRVGDHVAIASGVVTAGNYVPSAADGCSIVKTLSTNTITMDRPDLSRTGTDGVTTASNTFTSATAAFTSADTGAQIVCSAITAGTTITFVNATTVTLSTTVSNFAALTWTIQPTIASFAAKAGLVCGLRIGFLDDVDLTWTAELTSGGNGLARSEFWWNFNQEPNAVTLRYLAAQASGAGNTGGDLPSITVETAPQAGYANRMVVMRGDQRFGLRLHDETDGNAIVAGGVTELSTAGMVKRSTGVKTHLFGGLAMQPSPASGAVSVTNNGLVGNGAVVSAARPYLIVAKPLSPCPAHDAPSAAFVTTAGSPPTGVSATVPDGSVVVDATDGGVGAWDGSTTGLRVLGTATAVKAGGKVAMELIAPYWT